MIRRGLRRHGNPGTRGIFGRRGAIGWAAGLIGLTLTAAGCGLGGSSASGHTPVSGGSVSYALPANETPNYIFPFSPGQYFTQVNSDQLQYLLYRPLYWFGGNGLPYLNRQLSLAKPPVYHGQQVTIKLKRYRWSDGTTLTAADVVFWMNMMKAVVAYSVRYSSNSVNWGGYVPGEFPDNVSSVRAVGRDTVQMTIKGAYSRRWFTDNELSQITPMPLAWDATAAGKSNCEQVQTNCVAVFKYLDSSSKNPSSWVKSKIWSVVDGPFTLTGLNSQGVLTFQYNKQYSGPVPAHHISTFTELPFTSEEAEFNVLAAGGSHPIDVGYLPTVDAPVPPPGHSVGANPVSGYDLQPLYTWGLSYFPYNFGSADPQRAIISQVYFRQAMQLLEDQAAVIQGPLHGYGHTTTAPVGSFPRTKFLSPKARKGDPYPFNPGAARHLLTQHGWVFHANSAATCGRPGSGPTQCGTGVKPNTALNFTLYYATGAAWLESALLQLKSNAADVGINIELKPRSFNGVLSVVEGAGCQAGGCPWEIADWGQGWSYVPDYLPTGDELFQTNSFANLGQYSDKTNDQYIKATLHTSSMAAMYKWEDYLTKQLPVALQPDAPAALVESRDDLHIGVQSPTLAINPEQWYYLR
ncbi:MAG TPA: ABC transporter substrate-binding protein [Streptosporangiaceae bacterium]